MSNDRQLMLWAQKKLNAEEIAARMNSKPDIILKTARRLGVKLSDGRLKAKK
jgi:hypothetical protein